MDDEREKSWLCQVYQHSVSRVKSQSSIPGVVVLLCDVCCAMTCRGVSAGTCCSPTSEDKARRMTSRCVAAYAAPSPNCQRREVIGLSSSPAGQTTSCKAPNPLQCDASVASVEQLITFFMLSIAA
jgi:hypothetical protein